MRSQPQPVQPFFTVQANPAAPLVLSGGSGAVLIPVLGWNGFQGTVSVTMSALPSGLTASPTSFTVTPQGSPDVTVTFTAAASMHAGLYNVTFTGTSGSLIASTTVTVGVEPSPHPATLPAPQPLTTFANSIGTLVPDNAGNYFGVGTLGTYSEGTVFELASFAGAWQQLTLRNFGAGTDGSNPVAVTIDGSGNVYGVASQGGTNGFGTVFELNRASGWQETILHNFTGSSDGEQPEGGLVMDQAGNLYGTTAYEGYTGGVCSPNGCGTIFELTPSANEWSYKVIYSFTGQPDAAYPQFSLTLDSEGNIYGSTQGGGTGGCLQDGGCGAVFKLTPAGNSWQESVLYSFQGNVDGARPSAVILDPAGNLYGTSFFGGLSAPQCDNNFPCSSVFELSPSGTAWNFANLYFFTGGYGGFRPSELIFDASGNLYGVASGGVPTCDPIYGCGILFELSQSNGTWEETATYDFPGGGGLWGGGGVMFSGGKLYGVATVSSSGEMNTDVLFELAP